MENVHVPPRRQPGKLSYNNCPLAITIRIFFLSSCPVHDVLKLIHWLPWLLNELKITLPLCDDSFQRYHTYLTILPPLKEFLSPILQYQDKLSRKEGRRQTGVERKGEGGTTTSNPVFNHVQLFCIAPWLGRPNTYTHLYKNTSFCEEPTGIHFPHYNNLENIMEN